MNGVHPGSSLRRSAAALSVASLGLVLGHGLTYALDIPDPSVRAHVLASTGHGYLSTLAQLAAVAAVAGVAALFLGNVVRPSRSRSFTGTFVLLAAFQVVAFASMEVAERVAAGASLSMLARTGILPLGALLQILIAALGALVIRWVLRTADRAASLAPARRSRRPRLTLGEAPVLPDLPPSLPFAAARGIRGPPVSSTR
jgi:hypothetical protein